jgi:hypothetical protein
VPLPVSDCDAITPDTDEARPANILQPTALQSCLKGAAKAKEERSLHQSQGGIPRRSLACRAIFQLSSRLIRI